MWVPDGFETWGDYRSFVETSQRSLHDRLAAQYEQSALDIADQTTRWSLFTDEAGLGVGWWEPFRDKWMPRRIHYHDTVVHLLWQDDSQRVDDGTLLREQRDEIRLDERQPDSTADRCTYYEAQAPIAAVLTENYLDAVTCYLAGLAQVSAATRGAAYDAATLLDDHGNTTGQLVTAWLFEPFERAAVVDGSALQSAFTALESRYDRLAPLTVWGTSPGPDLAVPDDALPSGVGHARTWRVRPAPSLAGFAEALTEPETARGLVTVEESHTVETPTNHEITGFHRGTVDECDDEFPAGVGESVLVSTANVVEYAEGNLDSAGGGHTERQRSLLDAVKSAPEAASDDDLARVLDWATSGPPTVRARAAGVLAAVAVDTGAAGRYVDAIAEGLSDPETEVRRNAAAALERVGGAAPTALAPVVPALVSRLDDGAAGVREAAAAALATVARNDPSLLRDHVGSLQTQLERRVGLYHEGSAAVRTALLDALERLQSDGADVLSGGADAVVLAAAVGPPDQRAAALRTIAAASDDRNETVAAAISGQLVTELESDRTERRLKAARGLQRIAAVDTSVLLAGGIDETLLSVAQSGSGTDTERRVHPEIWELLAVLSVAHPERVAPDSVTDAVISALGTGRGLRPTTSNALGYLGYHHPEAVADAVEPLVRTARGEGASTGPRATVQALEALSRIAVVDPDSVDDAVVEAGRGLAETTDEWHVRSRALLLLAVAGEPVLSDDFLDRFTNGWESLLPDGRRTVVAAAGAIAAADRSFFTANGGFAWLYTVSDESTDPRVGTEAMCVLTECWLADPEFVESRSLPLAHDTIEESADGYLVDDTSGLLSLAFEDDSELPDARGIDVVPRIVAALDTEPVPTKQRRVARSLDGLSTGKHRDSAVEFERMAPLLDAVDAPSGTDPELADWEERLVSLAERAAAEYPDRTAPVIGALGTALLTGVDLDPRLCRATAAMLVRAGSASETVATAVVAGLLDGSDTQFGVATSAVLFALRQHADDAAVGRARRRLRGGDDEPEIRAAIGALSPEIATLLESSGQSTGSGDS